MEILYEDSRILVCLKPAGVISADDGPGCMPDLVRQYLNDKTACVRTVHRLDAAVSGVMVFARSQMAASILSEQIREHVLEKEYLAVVHGRFEDREGEMEDLLWYNRSLRKARVMDAPGKDVRRARLSYAVLGYAAQQDASLVKIRLHTGRTHQIRIQFSSRNHALLGDRKYGDTPDTDSPIALWSWRISFRHPQTDAPVSFCALPPRRAPWNLFDVSAAL